MATENVSEHQGGSPLVRLSNVAVALHRRHFGRGPGAARAFIVGGMAVCLLNDVYTQVERTLIEAGHFDHVQETRMLHRRTIEDTYKAAAEAVLGRRVISLLGAIDTQPDVAIDVFLLGDAIGSSG